MNSLSSLDDLISESLNFIMLLEKCLHDSEILTAVSNLSPVKTHILMPKYQSNKL
jgi:hypothetical protein